MTQGKETLEQELSDVNEAREQEKQELERKQAATKQGITELRTVKWSLRKLNYVNAEAHTIAVLTLVLPPTLVTTAAATMRATAR